MSNQSVKHTPGPWMIGYGGNESDDYAVITSPHQEHAICDLNPQGYNRTNATLIAAAPELLDAAKSLLEVVESNSLSIPRIGGKYTYNYRISESDVVELARTVIAKAEGRNR